jgi:hypothetical protein
MTYTCRDEKRSVKFSTSAKLRVYNFELSEAERYACWYTQEEYESFKAEVNATLAMIAQNQEIDENIICRRGVACKLPENQKTKLLNRRRAWGAVLDEQDRQKAEADGEYDVDAISFAYLRHSYICKRTAYLIGTCDEKAARVADSPSGVSSRVTEVDNYDMLVSRKGSGCSRLPKTQKIILSPERQMSSAVAA